MSIKNVKIRFNLRKVAKYVQEFEPVFLYLFAKQNTLGREINIRNMKQNIENSKRRIKRTRYAD